MKVNQSVKFDASGLTAGKLQEALASVPPEAKVDIHTTKGDRPWESDYHTITVSWSEER
jgi:hypothetical protein